MSTPHNSRSLGLERGVNDAKKHHSLNSRPQVFPLNLNFNQRNLDVSLPGKSDSSHLLSPKILSPRNKSEDAAKSMSRTNLVAFQTEKPLGNKTQNDVTPSGGMPTI